MISSPTYRQNEASWWIAPRCVAGMLPPTGVWLAGSGSPSMIGCSPAKAVIVIGAAAVPLVRTCTLVVSWYVPPRIVIVVPGAARATARWIVANGAAWVPGFASL